MTTNLPNRFTAMFEKTGVMERKPKSKKTIDFGSSLGDDEGINNTFKSLHDESVKPVVVAPVVVQTPFAEDVAVKLVALPPPDNLVINSLTTNSEKELSITAPSLVTNLNILPQVPVLGQQVHNSLSAPTIRPSDSQTVRGSDYVTVEQLDSATVGLSHSPTVSQSDSHTVAPLYTPTVTQLHAHTVAPFDPVTDRPLDTQTVLPSGQLETPRRQPDPSEENNHIPLDVLTLPYNQACVLEYLCKAGGTTNYRDINDHTSIRMPSARDAVARLIQKGFMSPLVTLRSAAFQGFSYVLNERMCKCFLAAGGLERNTYQTIPQTLRPSNNHTVEQSNSVSLHSSSVVLETRTATTTTEPSDQQTVEHSEEQTVRRSDSNKFVLVGPEAAYWEDIGLQERQTLKWCEEFEVSPNDMRQQLAWARWDLVQNGKEADVTKDPISWFFGCLRKTAGCYPRPENYQSPVELRASRLQLQQDKISEAQSALVEAELVNKFQTVMCDSQSQEYKELYDQASSFAKEQGGFFLETELKSFYIKKNGKPKL